MSVLGETIAFSILLIKLVIFWCKQRTFGKVLTMMAIDWEKCLNAEFSMFVTTWNARLSRYFANVTVALHTINIIIYSSVIVKQTDDKASNTSTRPLLMNMDLPFDFAQTYIYELIIIIQFVYLLLCACANGLLNALLINLTLHVGGQIDILCGWLTEVFPMKERCENPNLFMIKKIIKKHQQIITFSRHIEDLFSNIAIALFVSDTLIIGCLGFVIVTSIETPDAVKIIMKTLLFYLVVNIDAFAFCFAGEYLSTKSNSIGDAAYNSFWYESNSKNNRIISFLIMRSQTQLTITIGKVTNLSLERFSSIIKASASYISVLLAMN
ncbi:odorant receptor 4-like [Camponotus floridanus]|uniref:odorant receptor 4-like n=1 Tax=Camponotus floridanus TaxID=104421 RepID=UPI000DC6AE50|nr:odorant receptor 4-like [Camponotus floridanus]